MTLVLNLLILQALLGAFDVIYHHELKVDLPHTPTARRELGIHAVRALLYAVVFAGLAWLQWAGWWVFALVGIVAIEVLLTLWDFVVEDSTRLLPNSERITHTVLAVNGGAAFALLALELPQWFDRSTAFYVVDYGWRSWFLSICAIGVALSGLRDALAAWSVQRLDLQLNLDLGRHRRLLISGATGFIGSALCRELLRKGHDITVLSRHPVAATVQFGGKVRAITGTDQLSVDETFDAVINFAGAPVVGLPWTVGRRRTLTRSRVRSTSDLLGFVQRAHHKPAVWIQASAIGYYGTHSQAPLDETASVGTGFAAELCQTWESMTDQLRLLGVRCAVLRFGLVFGRSGGALPMLLLPFRIGVGTILGDGKQHIGWIHLEDLLRLIALAVTDESLQGKINAVAPESPTYAQFAQMTARMLHRPVLFSIPARLLRRLLGEMASMFVDGPHIVPRRLQHAGFEYRFPSLRSALMDLT
jgi:uncharacterized protein (TIGR01777 family)